MRIGVLLLIIISKAAIIDGNDVTNPLFLNSPYFINVFLSIIQLSLSQMTTSPDTNPVRSYNHTFCLGTNSILRTIPIPSANLLSKLTEGFRVPFSSLLISA